MNTFSRQLVFFKIFSFILAIFVIALMGYIAWDRKQDVSPPSSEPFVQADAPHSDFVEEFIEPLRYSGVSDFLRPEVYISIDFTNKVWTLHNIHHFDGQGNVLLNGGKYGVCGDLAAYAYQKIRPVFDSKYKIEFLRVAEASFFKPGSGSHIILRIIDTSQRNQGGEYTDIYVLDPALRRYGLPELFPTYLTLEVLPMLPFLEEKNVDESFPEGSAPPIIISRKALLSFYVTDENGKFDPDNFGLELALTKRYEYARRPVLIIKKSQGQILIMEDGKDIKMDSFFPSGVYDQLKQQLISIFNRIELKTQETNSEFSAEPSTI